MGQQIYTDECLSGIYATAHIVVTLFIREKSVDLKLSVIVKQWE